MGVKCSMLMTCFLFMMIVVFFFFMFQQRHMAAHVDDPHTLRKRIFEIFRPTFESRTVVNEKRRFGNLSHLFGVWGKNMGIIVRTSSRSPATARAASYRGNVLTETTGFSVPFTVFWGANKLNPPITAMITAPNRVNRFISIFQLPCSKNQIPF